jgi:invasion protein IalB
MVQAFVFALSMLTLLASTVHVRSARQSAWVKLCEEGYAQEKALKICLTYYERLDSDGGKVLVSAALRQIEGQEKQHFLVMVPLGMSLQPGMRATVFPKDLWEGVQKNERINKNEEARLKGLHLNFALCHAAGCTAEAEATSELLTSLKSGGGLMVFAVSGSGALTAFPVPLSDFAQALAGEPTPRSALKGLVEPRATTCDPYFDPTSNAYSCPRWGR